MDTPRKTHPKWTDEGFQPEQVSASGTYDAPASGPKTRKPLHDRTGILVGHVWTDHKEAAGFTPSGTPGNAASDVYVIHSRMKREGKPASAVLDPTSYAPMYTMGQRASESPSKQADQAIRRSRR